MNERSIRGSRSDEDNRWTWVKLDRSLRGKYRRVEEVDKNIKNQN